MSRQANRLSVVYLEFLPLAVLTVALVAQVLVPPIVGLADNGDYFRSMGTVGLRYLPGPEADRYHSFVNTRYRYDEPVDPLPYLSSDMLFVKAAMALQQALGQAPTFDLRPLAVLRLLALVGAVGLLLRAGRPLPLVARGLVAVLVPLVCADVGYAAYLNSLYSEPSSLIFLCLLLAAGLTLATRQPTPWPWLGVFYAAALLFVSAKAQNVSAFIVLAPAVYYLATTARGRWRDWVGAGLAAALCLFAVWYLGAMPQRLKDNTLYNMVFYELLRHSPSPAADLARLDLDPRFAQYVGTIIFTPGVPSGDEEFLWYLRSRLTYGKLFAIYASEPGRLVDLAARTARETFQLRPEYLGNFEQSAGQPARARSEAFAHWSSLLAAFPKSSWFLVLVVLGGALVALDAYRVLDPARRGVAAALLLTLVLTTVVQYGTVLVGDGGHERVKQLFLFNTLATAVLLTSLVWCATRGLTWLRRTVPFPGRSGLLSGSPYGR